jgi:REP-associated tyrosine transposase
MPRKPRLHVPGGLYHVILRGNNRQAIFFDSDDRRRWESLIEVGLDRYLHRIHAYCWMTNHVHMAIQCHERPLSGFMRFVASQYSRATNKKMCRTGHLFERRHRAILVQADSYLLELIRYVHLNPIRAGLVDAIEDYPWCSHHAYLGGNSPVWLTLNWALSAFGDSLHDARRQYARFVQTECPTSIREKFSAGSDDDHRILGDDGFFASLELQAIPPKGQPTLEELTQIICQKHDVSVAELRSPSRERRYAAIRAEVGLTAVEEGVASNAELARYFNRNQSGMSRAISQQRRKSK